MANDKTYLVRVQALALAKLKAPATEPLIIVWLCIAQAGSSSTRPRMTPR